MIRASVNFEPDLLYDLMKIRWICDWSRNISRFRAGTIY